mmetsp:Transcript_86847/g.218643  ORF Transcript_86847/g.218643 Transcript_86847/m.218643 type:complete len:317 (+) Transcript_86847:112-1062(+)
MGGPIHSAVLIALGFWLLVYRLLLRTACRPVAERMTTVACGVALALLAPLLPWPPQGFRALSLGLIGVLLSCYHPACTALIVSASLAMGFGGFLWQLGLCTASPEADLGEVGLSGHSLLLSFLTFLFIALFVFVPGVAGPATLILVLVPTLGALLLTVGIFGLWPSAGGLAADSLLAISPCAADLAGGLLASPAVMGLAAWLLIAAAGIGLQLFLARLARLKAESEEVRGGSATAPGGDLVASLLPGSQAQEGGGANLPRPTDSDAQSRFGLITKAIFADEGADLSHLTENEQKLVAVCRKDEFERDRILWGGGLI